MKKMTSSIAEFFGLRTTNAEVSERATIGSNALSSFAARRMALYIAVSYVSNALSKCEIKTYENGESVKNELYYALNVSPNPNQNGSSFINKLVENYFYDTHALMVQPLKSRNHFYIADSFGIEEKHLADNLFKSVVIERYALQKDLKASDVCYFKLENTEVIRVVHDLYRDLGELLGIAIQSYKDANGNKFTFETNASPSGTRGNEGKEQEELNDRLRAFIRNPNIILPLKANQKLSRVESNGNGSSDDVIALRKDIFETTANALKIPQSMMYGNMTNVDDIVKQFITFGVDPIAQMISDELTRKFYNYSTWRNGQNFIKVDTSRINHVDIFAIADKADKLISSGATCIDETRVAMGLQPLNTEFSQTHWVTKNYAPIEEVLEQLLTTGGGETNA